MSNIKSNVTAAWENIKSTVTTVLSNIGSAITNGFNTAKNNVTNALNAIKDKIKSVWDGAVSLVRGAVDKLKSLMNFHWELPKLKLPHIKISGSFSLNPPSVPHFSIEWYKKAMENGMILNSPTIFGAMGGNLLGGGEAGPEAIVGVDSLRSMIGDAVAAAANGLGGDITIPVYIGQQRIETIVVKAMQKTNYRSGGR
jgi:phage-related minor tail protein